MRLPSAKIFLQCAPRIPNCVVFVDEYHGAYSNQVFPPVMVFVDPAAPVDIEADFNQVPWSRADLSPGPLGTQALTISIEAPYIMFGSVGLLPITILLIAAISVPVLVVLLPHAKELLARAWHELSTRPGMPPFLLLLLSLMLPWPSSAWLVQDSYAGTVYLNSYIALPAIMQDFVWNQLTIVVPTAMPLLSLASSCLLWGSAAIAFFTIKKEQDQQEGLPLACVAVVLGLWPPIFMGEVLWFSLLGPIAAIAAILSPFVMKYRIKGRTEVTTEG